MISRIFRHISVFLVITFAFSATAQLKIAVVNVQEAIFETEQAKVQVDLFNLNKKPEQDALAALQEELVAMEDRIRKDADILSQVELQELQTEYNAKREDLQYRSTRLQNEIQTKSQQISREIAPKFQKVLNDLIEIEGYDMVLSEDPTITLYVNTKHVITRKVTELINETSDDDMIAPAQETETVEGESETSE